MQLLFIVSCLGLLALIGLKVFELKRGKTFIPRKVLLRFERFVQNKWNEAKIAVIMHGKSKGRVLVERAKRHTVRSLHQSTNTLVKYGIKTVRQVKGKGVLGERKDASVFLTSISVLKSRYKKTAAKLGKYSRV